ncbi:lanthionine synthetase C family protein [Saccharopolyspora phatthalungensis]|uniref:Lanthionine synthetase n=1 Tax=Saccharopolyspora phatthalungensis TaxID=664693 RepID=A0A840Q826_9PSEU|nr:lanthionine synthetase C family protein [Saccharopolyspora phatthalungensis]MBB5156087.1 hypothetical protein [Saccharopolyspora phatthalungensis]
MAERYATELATLEPPPEDKPWVRQSLTKGAAGIALLHVERAHAGYGTWQQAHRWIKTAVAHPISALDTAGLYQGAPAITLMLDAAATGAAGRYRNALADVDGHVAALAHRRVDAAMARMKAGELPGFREYDVFFGLAGIGALLLRRSPGSSAMGRILDYLVALTKPLQIEDQGVPGWWVGHDPHRRNSAAYRSGHGNFGMAHGICGPLALLSQAMRRGATVGGHLDAIITICDWLDAWRQDADAGPWWPEWITLDELTRGTPSQPGPARPSWCYGTPGIARAVQLAAIAISDAQRQRSYEEALIRCLDDPDQENRITDGGLCHGWAGVYQTAWRAAQDAVSPELASHLPRLAACLTCQVHLTTAARPGLLEGKAGTVLALHTAVHDVAPISGWDTCLLID